MKATLNPNVLRWARTRARMDETALAKSLGLSEKFPIQTWERTGEIEFSQLEKLAHFTRTPIGFLFLPHPPEERLPIKDFRRIGSGPVPAITPELLDVIYAAQRRQEWYRDFLKENGVGPIEFVGTLSKDVDVETAAEKIVSIFEIGPQLSINAMTWQQNLSFHLDAIENKGVLVMRSGVVGNSTNRKLSVDDFRGFALADDYAPVIFVNSSDSPAAQIFTLIHELVHIFINESAVSNLDNTYAGGQQTEKYCNAVAAEVLVPQSQIVSRWSQSIDPFAQIRRIALSYKVSSLVAARRVHDAGFITKRQFDDFFKTETIRFKRRTGGKGNIYNSINARVGGRFVQALVSHTLEGKTLYGDAMRLLGIKSSKVLSTLAKNHGYSNCEIPS